MEDHVVLDVVECDLLLSSDSESEEEGEITDTVQKATNDNVVKCKVLACKGQSFARPGVLKRHMKVVHTARINNFICPKGCGKLFTRKNDVKKHLGRVHSVGRAEAEVMLINAKPIQVKNKRFIAMDRVIGKKENIPRVPLCNKNLFPGNDPNCEDPKRLPTPEVFSVEAITFRIKRAQFKRDFWQKEVVRETLALQTFQQGRIRELEKQMGIEKAKRARMERK